MKKVNFGHVAHDYAKYRDELPSIIFQQLLERNISFKGKYVLDLGAGSGIFSRAMSQQGATVTGIEPEQNLINQAEIMDQSIGQTIKYIHTSAESMSLVHNSIDQYDMITALRSWHWFNRDIVNHVVMQHLRKQGYLIVIHSAFVPQHSQEAQETIRAIKECIPNLKPAGSMGEAKERRNGLPVNWFGEWERIGFRIIDEWQYDYQLVFGIDEWCGKVRSLSWLTNENEEVKGRIMNKVKEYLSSYSEPLSIPHQYSVVILQK
ncbi:class I SAM-dependent methyltransferase [Paenibacillus sp. FSL W7-1287]|uniref:class I SAM-dependent methyltransferase n=1 Tax=Paenibacillus sp. FSL W7-1287 TaxID=2954538 RepID=UPI0030F81588